MPFDLIKKAVKSVSASLQMRAKKDELKRKLLERFTVKQLESIAKRYGVALEGARTKAEKIERIASQLGFDEVVGLAKRYKVKYKDLLKELEEFERSLTGS